MAGGVSRRKDKKIIRPNISSQSQEFSHRPVVGNGPSSVRADLLKIFN